MSNSIINVCHEIRCPFSKKNGGDRYSISHQCHLLAGERYSVSDPSPMLRPNQYWLFADDYDQRLDINALYQENLEHLGKDEVGQRRLEMEAKMGDDRHD